MTYAWKPCPACRRDFPARAGHALYCSRTCREANRPRRPRARKPVEVHLCGHCGVGFSTTVSYARYCSAACREKARAKRSYRARLARGMRLVWVKQGEAA